MKLVDRLVTDIIEITEGLMKMDSPTHALSVLAASSSSAHKHEGKIENNRERTGATYARPC